MDASASAICELSFETTILAVRINDKRLVVVQQRAVSILDLHTAAVLQSLATPPNPSGLVALSPSVDNCWVVFPKSATTGELVVYDAMTLEARGVVRAHKAPIAALAFNLSGTLLATASTTGTVVRVFAMPSGEKVFTFRRGTSTSTIHSLAFSRDSSFLAAAGSSPTVHVYRLAGKVASRLAAKATGTSKATRGGAGGVSGANASSASESEGDGGGSKSHSHAGIGHSRSDSGSLSWASADDDDGVDKGSSTRPHSREDEKGVSKLLGGMVSGALKLGGMEGDRDFARARLRTGVPRVVAITEDASRGSGDTGSFITVVTDAGVVCQYVLDRVDGGDARLKHEYVLDEGESEAIAATLLP